MNRSTMNILSRNMLRKLTNEEIKRLFNHLFTYNTFFLERKEELEDIRSINPNLIFKGRKERKMLVKTYEQSPLCFAL